eukprot:scaffold12646_cov146-Skeletonema_dohrnii-CCMP3373.AAC.2
MELSEYHSWEKDFGLVYLKIDIVSIFFPSRAEGREFSSTVKELWVVLFLLVSQPGQLGAGRRAIGWAGTPWLDASGGGRHRFRAKLAKTGHSSQAETLGVSLNHKSNLVPSGSIGHPSNVSWPLRGDGDKYTLRSGNQQPTTISNYLSRGSAR